MYICAQCESVQGVKPYRNNLHCFYCGHDTVRTDKRRTTTMSSIKPVYNLREAIEAIGGVHIPPSSSRWYSPSMWLHSYINNDNSTPEVRDRITQGDYTVPSEEIPSIMVNQGVLLDLRFLDTLKGRHGISPANVREFINSRVSFGRIFVTCIIDDRYMSNVRYSDILASKYVNNLHLEPKQYGVKHLVVRTTYRNAMWGIDLMQKEFFEGELRNIMKLHEVFTRGDTSD